MEHYLFEPEQADGKSSSDSESSDKDGMNEWGFKGTSAQKGHLVP